MPVSDQGITHSHYTLIPRTLIFLTREDHILLIKGSPHKRLWANLYNGIGGHIESGEDVTSAAYRELQEEIGLVPEDIWLCGVITIDTGQNPGIVLFVYRGECASDPLKASSEGSTEWINYKKLAQLPVVEDLPIILDKIMPMRKGEPPFSAFYSYDIDGRLVISFVK